jgi:predicted HTH transcriptional regulator
MGRAEDLFERLKQHGEEGIDQLIQDRQSEELFLDFKRSANNGSGRRLHEDDRQNLARAISGFGNSEGGIIIWGVDCRDRAGSGDLPSEKNGIDDPKRFVSWLEGAVSGCIVAPHPGVTHHAIETGKGFAITHIPKSELAPSSVYSGGFTKLLSSVGL